MSIDDPRAAPEYDTSGIHSTVAVATNAVNSYLQTINSGPNAAHSLLASRYLNAFCDELRKLPNVSVTVSGAFAGLSSVEDSNYGNAGIHSFISGVHSSIQDDIASLYNAHINSSTNGFNTGPARDAFSNLVTQLNIIA